jgi:mRNA-degrading endonuclease toxin of MazEF toxin-antitoxin module
VSLAPKVGWLLSYSYLWADDHRRGDEEGTKNRPCALVAATRRDGNRIVVVVVPVTHTPPVDAARAIEIPAVTKARLGLDAQRSWIICNEANVFAWPGPDLRSAAGRTPPSIWYGPLPPKLVTAAREKLLAYARAGRLRRVPRTE